MIQVLQEAAHNATVALVFPPRRVPANVANGGQVYCAAFKKGIVPASTGIYYPSTHPVSTSKHLVNTINGIHHTIL